MNRRASIGTVPEDIETCLSQLKLPTVHENPNAKGTKDKHRQFIQKLRQKFFPFKRSTPPPFFQEIFDLVATTCTGPMCKMDDAISLLEKASDVVHQTAFASLSLDSR